MIVEEQGWGERCGVSVLGGEEGGLGASVCVLCLVIDSLVDFGAGASPGVEVTVSPSVLAHAAGWSIPLYVCGCGGEIACRRR